MTRDLPNGNSCAFCLRKRPVGDRSWWDLARRRPGGLELKLRLQLKRSDQVTRSLESRMTSTMEQYTLSNWII